MDRSGCVELHPAHPAPPHGRLVGHDRAGEPHAPADHDSGARLGERHGSSSARAATSRSGDRVDDERPPDEYRSPRVATRAARGSAAEAADDVVEDRQARAAARRATPARPPRGTARGIAPPGPAGAARSRTSARRVGHVLGIGRERRHHRQRHAVGVVIADRRVEEVAERAVGRCLDRLAPDDAARCRRRAAGRPRAGARSRRACPPRSCPGRTRQSTSIDRLARDDVVLDAGVDDVRADRVADERPERPGVHRVAQRVERGSAAAASVSPVAIRRRTAAASPAEARRPPPRGSGP